MNILNNGIVSILDSSSSFYLPLMILAATVCALASYLLGSLSSSIIVSKGLYKEDVRQHGSGNAGLTNMLRTYGAKAAVLTLVGDMLKTAVAILITAIVFGFSYDGGISLSGPCYLAGSFAVLGHVFPVFYGFKGGKGVLVTATMALILSPLSFLVLLFIFAIILLISRYVSLGSVTVAFLYPICVCLHSLLVCGQLPILTAVSTVFLGGFVIWCHRANIKRLLNGNEKKFSVGKKEKP